MASFTFFKGPTADRWRPRPGMSLIELLLASAVMAMIATAIGALALAVSTGSQLSRGQNAAVQHARVALDRIRNACLDAHANETFPGFLVVPTDVDDNSYPDTLVVWRTSSPVDSEGLPRFSELVIFMPDPASPRRLLEVTASGDIRTVPAPTDIDAWRLALAGLLKRNSTKTTQLTDLLRTPKTTQGTRRAALRFDVTQRPSAEDLADFRSDEIGWDELPWAQSTRGGRMGLRQSWCRIEMQLMPGGESMTSDPEGVAALTFFGSAAIYYGVER